MLEVENLMYYQLLHSKDYKEYNVRNDLRFSNTNRTEKIYHRHLKLSKIQQSILTKFKNKKNKDFNEF
jgi:hypothetical protein